MPQFPMPMPMRGRGRGRGFGRGMPFPHFNGPGPEYNPNEQGMPPMPFFPGQQIPQDVFPAGTSGTQQPPSDRNGVTLLVSDIPYAHLSLESIVNYFKKFGTVTNVAIEGKSKRALVSFSTNREAYVAWRSDEAVFGSRHVKVLWHRPMKGQAAAGLEALEKSAPLLENLRRIEAEGAQAAQAGVKAKLSGPSSKLEQKLKQERELQQRVHLERLIAEQKVLLVRIEKEDKAERKALMARCKEIEVEMQKVKDGVEEEPVQAPTEDSHPTAKEKLDAELAALGMQTKDEETMALQKKLDDLKAQALTMGIDPTAPASPAPARGAWRGRARGRGRGRGGFAGPMRLDNRSRVVEVGGDGVAENKAAVQQWYESTGGEVGENDGTLTVSYPSRELAEKVCLFDIYIADIQALALGTKIPSVTAPVTVKWSQSRAPASAPEPVVERDERRTEREMDDEMQS
jgi:RNA-binding protein 26